MSSATCGSKFILVIRSSKHTHLFEAAFHLKRQTDLESELLALSDLLVGRPREDRAARHARLLAREAQLKLSLARG